MKERIDAVIDGALANKTITGTIIIVKKDGETVYERVDGFADRESGKPVEMDTIFRLASVTKPMVAATALAMIDDGKLSLDTLVRDHLPYFTPKEANGNQPDITIRHLITHTAGFSYGVNDYAKPAPGEEVEEGLGPTEQSFEEAFTKLAALPLLYTPGKLWRYSTGIDVLGAVIAKIEGTGLHEALAKYVTGPLGMADTGFKLTDEKRLATPYADAAPEPERMRDPHPMPAAGLVFSPGRIFRPNAYQSGGAGAVGTAPDLIKFFEAIQHGGEPILSPEISKAAMSNQIGSTPRRDEDVGKRFGFLGAVVEDPQAAKTAMPEGTVSWGGVYGHNWFVDPVNKITALMMSNNAVEGCIGAYPKNLTNAIYGA